MPYSNVYSVRNRATLVFLGFHLVFGRQRARAIKKKKKKKRLKWCLLEIIGVEGANFSLFSFSRQGLFSDISSYTFGVGKLIWAPRNAKKKKPEMSLVLNK